MLFETGGDKSSVQLAVEAVLAAPVARTDMEGRKQRTRAAMVAEIADIGYANTKIATVAKRAQVSTATIYRDFGDRDGLIMSALEWVIGIFASHWVSDVAETDPIKRIEALLLAHGKALSDPFMGWIFRLYVHIANTVAPQLFALARASRDANLAIWLAEIARLERDGHVVKTDHQITVAIILGAIERRSILARMAFGENDGHKPTIPDIARHMAQALFQVFGTKAFWAARGGDVPTSWGANGPVDHGLNRPRPHMLLELPSARLRAHAYRVLARDVNRLDAEGRHVRVQLAAMLECAEHGYEAASMAGVATRAGVSTATLYQDYPDKRALFIDAAKLQARFGMDYNSLIDPKLDPTQILASLNYSIVSVLADPDFLWFHRVSMASEISDAPDLIAASRLTRSHTEDFWFNYLTRLEEEGFLHPSDHALTTNLLLGPTQRRSITSMIFFGVSDVTDDNLADLALASTDFVVRLLGRKVG